MDIIHNPTEEPQEGDTRTYTNDKGNKVYEVFRCRHRVPGMEVSILCDKNQHGCIETRSKASITCKRRELVWIKKINF